MQVDAAQIRAIRDRLDVQAVVAPGLHLAQLRMHELGGVGAALRAGQLQRVVARRQVAAVGDLVPVGVAHHGAGYPIAHDQIQHRVAGNAEADQVGALNARVGAGILPARRFEVQHGRLSGREPGAAQVQLAEAHLGDVLERVWLRLLLHQYRGHGRMYPGCSSRRHRR